MEKEGLPVDEGPVKLKEEEGWPKVEEDNPLGDLRELPPSWKFGELVSSLVLEAPEEFHIFLEVLT